MNFLRFGGRRRHSLRNLHTCWLVTTEVIGVSNWSGFYMEQVGQFVCVLEPGEERIT